MWTIPRPIVNAIFGHAQRLAPQECVGILTGKGHLISGWSPLTNIHTDPHRFLADPTEQIQLFAKLREENREVVAIYHSHPNATGQPSTMDLEQINYPNALYLIIGLGTDGRLDLNGFLLEEGAFVPQFLTICEA
ncbi:MAG: M67 family metallopeptidase [Magnetococcus sp. DMHC-6]